VPQPVPEWETRSIDELRTQFAIERELESWFLRDEQRVVLEDLRRLGVQQRAVKRNAPLKIGGAKIQMRFHEITFSENVTANAALMRALASVAKR